MPPVKMRGDGRMAANPKKTLFRLLSYLKPFWPILVVVMICIVINAIAQTAGSVALGKLVDNHILPMVETGSTDFAPVVQFLLELLIIYVIGLIGSFLRNFLMAGVTQKTQKNFLRHRDRQGQRLRYAPGTGKAGRIFGPYLPQRSPARFHQDPDRF